MHKIFLKKFLSFALFVLSIVAGILFFLMNKDAFLLLPRPDVSSLFYLIAVILVGYISVSEISRLLVKKLGVILSFVESYLLSLVNGFYNLITPFRGGIAFRAVYLKKKHSLSYAQFVSVLSGTYIMTFFVSSLLALVSFVFISDLFSRINQIIFSSLILIASSSFVLIFFNFKIPYLGKFSKRINNAYAGWKVICSDKRLLLLVFFLTAFHLVFSALSFFFQFKAIGTTLSFSSAIFLSSMGALSIPITITPAGLGIQEAVTVFSSVAIGISATESFAAAVLGRLVSMSILFVLGPISIWILLKNRETNK